MSDGTCPTVKVKSDNEQGYTVFDADAFNPDTQELYIEPSDQDTGTQQPDNPAPTGTPAPTSAPVVTPTPSPTPAPKAKGK